MGLFGIKKKNSQSHKQNNKDLSIINSVTLEALGLDSLLIEAANSIFESQKASIGNLQRVLKLGFNRAATIMKQLSDLGVISESNGADPRIILMTSSEFYNMLFVLKKNYIEKGEKPNVKKIGDNEIKHTKINSSSTAEEDEDYANAEKRLWLINTYQVESENCIDTSDINSFENLLIYAEDTSCSEDFVVNLMKKYSYEVLQILFIGELYEFYGSPYFIMPSMGYYPKSLNITDYLFRLISERQEKFILTNAQTIENYNEKMKKEKVNEEMPHVFFVVEELHSFLNISPSVPNVLIELLLNSKRYGIHFVAFTRFSERSLNLGALKDLLISRDADSVPGTKSYKEDSYFENDNKITLDYIDNYMNGREFEIFSGKLLEQNGFYNVEVTKASNDFGVDVTAYKDDIKYAIQCKKYTGTVGIEAVQEVIGSRSMYGCHVGVVLTNSDFTNSAKELAQKNQVLLWDRKKLIELMKNY